MNQILHKTLLDALLTSTQQNPFAKSFAFDWARSAGAFLNIKGNVDNGTELNGTALDDQIIIGGNLIGGNGYNNATSVNLFDGNDTLTVGGKAIVGDGQYISITGGEGNNTVNLNGGIDLTTVLTQRYQDSSINISLNGSGTNTVNVTGDIVSDGPSYLYFYLGYYNNTTNNNIIKVNGSIISKNGSVSNYDMTGFTTNFTVQNDIILENNSDIESFIEGVDNSFKVKGDFILDNSNAFLCLSEIDLDDKNSTLTIDIGGLTKITNSGLFWMIASEDYTTSSFNDISITKGEFNFEVAAGISSDLVINGDIVANDDGAFYIMLLTEKSSSVEVDGKIVVQGETTYSDPLFSRITNSSEYGTVALLGGISNDRGKIEVEASGEHSNIYVGNDITISDSHNITTVTNFIMGYGDDTFTLVGNMSATGHGENIINTGAGNDTIKLTGDISASNGGSNSILAGKGDDFIYLNGRIGAGALSIDAGDGNDTLVLTAVTQRLFETDYKEWLTDLSASGSLAKSNLETIRVDVNSIQQSKLGWLTDIVNKANADGAHITLEDKAGHQLVNPSTYLAQNNDTHNPINDVLDHYAPATTNAAQPKTFADNVAAPSADAFAAPHFDNNSFLHEMEQQAQVHAAAA